MSGGAAGRLCPPWPCPVGAGLSADTTLLGGREHGEGERVMTEAGSGSGHAEIERRLVQRSMEDEDFRQRLLDNPKAVVEQELGTPAARGR